MKEASVQLNIKKWEDWYLISPKQVKLPNKIIILIFLKFKEIKLGEKLLKFYKNSLKKGNNGYLFERVQMG